MSCPWHSDGYRIPRLGGCVHLGFRIGASEVPLIPHRCCNRDFPRT